MYRRRLFKQGNSICLTLSLSTLHKMGINFGDEVLVADGPNLSTTISPLRGPDLHAGSTPYPGSDQSSPAPESNLHQPNPCPQCGQLTQIMCITCGKPLIIPESIALVLTTPEVINNLSTDEKPPSPFPTTS